MASRTGTIRKIPVLPAGVSDFMRRRAIEMIGVALAVVGLLALVALASHTAADPSWNTASDGPIANLLGRAGAWISDFLLQIFGVAALVPAAALLVWGWRLWQDNRLAGLWIRLTGTAATLLGLPPAAMLVAPNAGWPVYGGSGGWVGGYLAREATVLASIIGAPVWLAATLISLIAFIALVIALGITRAEWRAAGAGAARVGRGLALLWAHAPHTLSKLQRRRAERGRARAKRAHAGNRAAGFRGARRDRAGTPRAGGHAL